MGVLIASVPHAGTFFTASLFEKAGYELRPEWVEIGSRTVHIWHFCEPETQIEKFLTENFVVIPLRDRASVEATWKRNMMRPEQLAAAWGVMESPRFARAFRLQIDGEMRDSQLSRLSQILGVPLNTDWYPINSLAWGDK